MRLRSAPRQSDTRPAESPGEPAARDRRAASNNFLPSVATVVDPNVAGEDFGQMLKQLRPMAILGVDQQVIRIRLPGQGSIGYGHRMMGDWLAGLRCFANVRVSAK